MNPKIYKSYQHSTIKSISEQTFRYPKQRSLDIPNYIDREHWHEWIIDSVVHPDIVKLNVKSLNEDEAYEHLCYGLPDKERRNDGRLRDKWIYRYKHLAYGSWAVNGVDVLANEDSQWGQVKPNKPYRYKVEKLSPGSKTKAIKYEAPARVATEAIALKVSHSISSKIKGNHFEDEFLKSVSLQGLRTNTEALTRDSDVAASPDAEDREFWQWVKQNESVPLIVTEGAKKAGSLISAGYAAIALPGINSGYRQDRDESGKKIGLPRLIPQLQAFAQKGREIIFCFDNDIKVKTRENVNRAIAKTGKLFQINGCKVSVIQWQGIYKGIDDLIHARGQDYFYKLFKDRISLDNFKLQSLLDISKYKPLIINQRYLDDNLIAPDDAQLIGLRSPKGSNKSGWMSKIVEQNTHEGKPTLVITHRIQLAKALCSRFGLDHVEDVRSSDTKGVLGYGMCVDSLHPNSQARFNPEDWEGATVILDEIEQVLWHALDSPTCQSNRVAIIENFKRLLNVVIQSGGKIYVADADLSSISLDYITSVVDRPIKTWVVDNLYKRPEKRKLTTYKGSNPLELLSELYRAIEQGEKIIVHTSGQKAKSKYGTINLESSIRKRFSERKILRIDRESVADRNHPAYGCMENLDFVIQDYDIVIASPVIETGVSIDVKNHFDSVWCIAYGVQTVDAVCQSLERLREDVPRHIWVKKNASNNRIGNGSTLIKSLLRSEHQITRANMSLLQQSGISEFNDLDIEFSPESLLTWAKRACLINSTKINYRDSVISKLLNEGYELHSENNQDDNPPDLLEIKDQLNETRDENYIAHCKAVVKSITPSDKELDALADKRSKTQDERNQENKGNLLRKYGDRIEVTTELVARDDNGWYGKLQLQYYLTMGRKYAELRNKKRLADLREQSDNKAFKPDLNKKLDIAQIKALELIDLKQFFDSSKTFTKNSLENWLENVVRFRREIKTLLGVSINPEKDSAIAVAQRLLAKLGLKLISKGQRRINGERVRLYQGCDMNPDKRSLVFETWLERDELNLSVTPFRIDNYTGDGVPA